MSKALGMLITIAFLATSVQADTYKWMDDQGTVNFAEDPGTIPQKYRKKAKNVDEEEAVDAVLEKGSGEKVSKTSETKGTSVEQQEKKKEQKKKAVYGNKDESAWKSEFARLRNELKSLDEQLGSKRTLFSDPSKLSRTQYKSLQYEIKNLEQLRIDLSAKLESLRVDAAREGVPAEIQQ